MPLGAPSGHFLPFYLDSNPAGAAKSGLPLPNAALKISGSRILPDKTVPI
jgi:hypothetical protein